MRHAALTFDLEQDCPPFLDGYRGMRDGLPLVLELLRRKRVHATFFATGEVARRFPEMISELVADGHELGSHGDSHRRFSSMTDAEARVEIETASRTLRLFAPVTSFRAPNLDLPVRLLSVLSENGYRRDASLARYKPGALFASPRREGELWRLPASTTPSAIRLPAGVRRFVLARLRPPPILFFHPWEFVDMRAEPIPIDCRFNTGNGALESLEDAIGILGELGYEFRRINDLHPLVGAAATRRPVDQGT